MIQEEPITVQGLWNAEPHFANMPSNIGSKLTNFEVHLPHQHNQHK
jgi:hypothetical protein